MSYQLQTSSGRSVACAPGQSMLDAFLRNSVWIPNSCNQGTCGTCKVKVLSGTVEHSAPPVSVLAADLQKDGFVLSCQAIPTSDVAIETPATDDVGVLRHPLRDLTATVVEIKATAHDTVSLFVELDEDTDFAFSAGQYMEIAVPARGTVRQYSMANAPSSASKLEFHIRREPGGLATDRWIFDGLAVGDPVDLTGPWGDFCYDESDPDAGIILLAGGTGLAPLKSIALQALSLKSDREIHVYHGVRNQADLYDVEFWKQLSIDHGRVRYVPCLSREDWSGRRGYVGDAVVEDFDSCKAYTGYLCGPPAMVDAGVKALKRRRMAPRRIKREKYSTATGGMTTAV